MTTMTDRDVIAWARDWAEAATGDAAEIYRRLADLAEKATEDWQPIATAPMGRSLFVSAHGDVFVGHKRPTGLWCNGLKRSATLWRPLPAPPGSAPLTAAEIDAFKKAEAEADMHASND